MNLSIISVNWNSVDYLLECIPSIYTWTRDVTFEIIVVDNASPRADADRLKEHFPEIKLVKSNVNLGFAGANNQGVKHSSGDWLLFLNPDTKLANAAINIMLCRAQSLSQVGVLGCTLLNEDLSVQTSSIMKFPGIINRVFQAEYLRLRWPKLWGIGPLFSAGAKTAEVEAISGACMLMRREVFDKVGGFSDEYFMYSEDLDLCYQCIRSGFTNYYINEGRIIHYGGKSSSPAWQTAMKTAAELQFCERNYGHLYALWFRTGMIVNAGLRMLLIKSQSILSRVCGNTSSSQVASAKIEKWRVVLTTLLGRATNHLPSRPMARVSCQEP